MASLHLILGGARSGKSALAERVAIEQAQTEGKTLVYVATAEAKDQEMAKRILQHQEDRSADWQTVECPLQLTQVLAELRDKNAAILVDCLTLWVTNNLCQPPLSNWQQAKAEFIELLSNWQEGRANLILVSNEVGHGIVPLGELSRQFVDESGWLHQDVAKLANRVDFVMAGLPMTLKGSEGK